MVISAVCSYLFGSLPPPYERGRSGGDAQDDDGGCGGDGGSTLPHPSKKGLTVYTRRGCDYSLRAKSLGEDVPPRTMTFIECDDLFFRDGANLFFAQMCEFTRPRTHRTFPFVFWDGKFIGGYAEMRNKYDEWFLLAALPAGSGSSGWQHWRQPLRSRLPSFRRPTQDCTGMTDILDRSSGQSTSS